jgi:hypothetical protein
LKTQWLAFNSDQFDVSQFNVPEDSSMNPLPHDTSVTPVPSNPYGSPVASTFDGSGARGHQRRELKRVDYISAGKLFATLYALIGVVFGALFFLISVLGVTLGNAGVSGVAGGLMVAVFIPIANGISGFIGGMVLAGLYNLAASLVGGIEFDME